MWSDVIRQPEFWLTMSGILALLEQNRRQKKGLSDELSELRSLVIEHLRDHGWKAPRPK